MIFGHGSGIICMKADYTLKANKTSFMKLVMKPEYLAAGNSVRNIGQIYNANSLAASITHFISFKRFQSALLHR